ncbi:hypothetical protein [Pseudotabrizicola algicola]|uniref:Uncharacterized protein n=1 Tax=Pseudotabrizicola algicola TaxID=2709381 RepID=A0A6B3RW12_9RHOB|nr:hypothetical protein [Pseudotabrizicola algicola]NEX47189.1 hypothetical protein [Pseudotabrizicola algicola]
MSAPQTNIDKQQRRHRGPLIGMILVVIAVGIGFVWWLGYEAAESDPLPGPSDQIDGRTGETVPGDAPFTAPPEGTPPVQQSEQPTPGVPNQTVDPLTPADVPAVDPLPESSPIVPAN